jgi:GH18 family chitinase
MVHAILLLPLLPLIIKQSFAKILLATNGSAAIPKSAVVDATAPKYVIFFQLTPHTHLNTLLRVVAYYLGYSNYRPGAPFTALEIDGSKLTHLIYGFLDVNMTLPGQVELASGDPWADLNRPFGYMNSWNCPCCVQGNFEQLYLLKRKYPHLQTLLSIGGWEYSTLISDAVLTAENRKKFAESCVQWTINYGFDGIDLDWEFPRKFNAYSVINDILYEMQVIGGKDGTKHNENDCFNMEAFLQELRRQFDALGYNKRFLYVFSIIKCLLMDLLRITLTLFWTLEFNFQCVDFFKVKNSIDWVF